MQPITNGDSRQGMTSASNAMADRLCPGRFKAQVGCAEIVSNDAEAGRIIHQALAGNQTILQSLTLDQREVFDACREIEKRLMLQYLGNEPTKVFREERYWANYNDGERIHRHSGTPDAVFRSVTKALIVDYKTGQNEAPVSSRNEQLRDLSCLVRGHFVVIDEVAVAIIQPLVTHSPELCIYSKYDLDRAAALMFERVVASNNPLSPRIPGEAQCKFCRAQQSCGEYQRWAGSTVPGMASILDVPAADWTPEQRAIFCDKAGIAEKWLNDTWDAMRKGSEEDPMFVPGYGLKPGRFREVITDPQACFDRFSALGGTIEQFMKAVNLAKGKLKEALHEVTGARGKSLDNAMKTLSQDISETKQDRSSLVKLEE